METKPCPICQQKIVVADNNVYLDYPAVPWDGRHAGWTIMPLGGLQIASNGDPDARGMAHTLHEHQPPESVLV